jgi:hypothetical protein
MNENSAGILSENIVDDLADENHRESAFFDFVEDEVVAQEIMLESNSDATEKAAGTQPLVLEDYTGPSAALAVQDSVVSFVAQEMSTLFVVSFSYRYSRMCVLKISLTINAAKKYITGSSRSA